MKFSTKLAIGSALALASVSAFAQVSVPAGPYAGTLDSPAGGNGSAFLTLFSSDDTTPYSYEFNLGLHYNDLLPTNGMNAAGLTLTWNLTGLTVPAGVNTSTLLWDVSAMAQKGSIAKVGGFNLLTTVDPAVDAATTSATTSGALSFLENTTNTFISNLNGTPGNPHTTTSTTDPTYANAKYGIGLNNLPYAAAAGVDTALNFFEFNSKVGTSSKATTTQYAGTWSLNLAADTLTYNVPGGTTPPPPVPLPAALWLLVSGLTGMGVLGRRKTAAVAA